MSEEKIKTLPRKKFFFFILILILHDLLPTCCLKALLIIIGITKYVEEVLKKNDEYNFVSNICFYCFWYPRL